MDTKSCIRLAARWVMGGLGLAGASYAAYAGTTWYRYGNAKRPKNVEDGDALLDQFMPNYEVVERHHVRVAAPAGITLCAAAEMDLLQSALVRGIFKGRELILGADRDDKVRPRGLLEQTKDLGWRLLAEIPDREIVMGAVTQPWMANPVFRGVPSDEFAAFNEPGYVKIVWTLRADPVSATKSVFRTETRVTTTDPGARRAFRRYWSLASPGIVLIRRMMLRPLKAEAERRARAVAGAGFSRSRAMP